jgi:hypothetical protein
LPPPSPFLSNGTEDGQAHITVTYVKDGTRSQEFHPQETWHSGMHVLNLFYPLLDMAEKMLHTFEVWISVGSGSAMIAAQNILAASQVRAWAHRTDGTGALRQATI